MKSSYKLAIWLLAGLLFQTSIYFYLDRVLFAPATSFQVSAVTEAHAVIDGQTYYSRNKRYMAVVKDAAVEIYATSPKSLLRSIPLNQQKVSYFKWLEDRDLALMAVYNDAAKDAAKVVLTQINPHADGHQLSTTIDKLPAGSKITDVAYSTATNVIYMQVLVASGPDQYRVYRTDANQDLTRVYLSGSRIGRIGVLFDHDSLIYDNLAEGIVYVRNGDGSWRVISPYGAKYNLVGVDGKNNIYLAKVNTQGLAETVLKGKLKVGFELDRTLTKPTDVRFLTMDGVEAPAKK
ncbi:hypothetical protein [Anaerospora hongkongensis]|uniref:hypothetical protein n=1 Tax=Anaerospora hongkongensis TaxID=244830 RepID=UPI0028A07116|nr:hypothetical protein [Anaerospora hongkongensis]